MLDSLVAGWFVLWVLLGLHHIATTPMPRGMSWGFIFWIIVWACLPGACLITYRLVSGG